MSPCRILVVEDHELFRRVISSILQRRSDFQTVGEASDGLEAIHFAEKLQPDLVLLDIGLPKLNGLNATKLIRGVAPHVKILFLSQESSHEIARECLRSGGLGYVQKMCAESDLLPAIDSVLDGVEFVSSGLAFQAVADAQANRRHEIVFCADEETLLNSLAQFIGAAFSISNPAIVWATELHRNALTDKLRAQGIDINAAFRRGIYISADVSERADINQTQQVVEGLRAAASKAGKAHPRVAVCGERAGCLWAEGNVEEAIRLEQLWNELAATQDLDIRCVYPAPSSHDGDQALEAICSEHGAVCSA